MCRNGYFECDNGQHYYCPWERCDDHRQCNDGIDERDCPCKTSEFEIFNEFLKFAVEFKSILLKLCFPHDVES